MPNLHGDDQDDDDTDLEHEIDEFVPSPMPPMGPDGGPIIPAPRRLSVIPDGQGLCTDGPGGMCTRYHKLVVSVDAEMPDDGSAPAHVGQRTVHTCYPQPGIELDLGDQHVFECNRYAPAAPPVWSALESSEPEFEEMWSVVIDQSLIERMRPLFAAHDIAPPTIGETYGAWATRSFPDHPPKPGESIFDYTLRLADVTAQRGSNKKSTPSSTPRAKPRSSRGPSKKRRPGRR